MQHNRLTQFFPSADAKTAALFDGFYRLVLIDQRLLDVEAAVAAIKLADDDPRYWPEYERWKSALRQIVGDEATKHQLRNPEAWDVAHGYLLALFERGNPT